jgi:hypothetical protein
MKFRIRVSFQWFYTSLKCRQLPKYVYLSACSLWIRMKSNHMIIDITFWLLIVHLNRIVTCCIVRVYVYKHEVKYRHCEKKILCCCDPSWYGISCQHIQEPSTTCSCAPGSLCISSYTTSICVYSLVPVVRLVWLKSISMKYRINVSTEVNVYNMTREKDGLHLRACVPTVMIDMSITYPIDNGKRITLFRKFHPYEADFIVSLSIRNSSFMMIIPFD